MKYIKISLYLAIFIINFHTEIIAGKGLLVAATEAAAEGANTVLEDNLPAVAGALAGFGSQFGVGALQTIGAGITTTATAAKAAAVAVIAAPATPVVVGLVVVGGVGYVGYKYYGPTAQREAALKKCLEENQSGPRATSGVPRACQDKACSLALADGRESVDKIVKDFVAYAPEVPAPTMWERASAACSSVVNSSTASAVHSVITAPYDYTIGALANRSGLASAVGNVEFFKNDSCYSATVGNGALNVGKYALAVGAAYCVYRGAKAAYNYAAKAL